MISSNDGSRSVFKIVFQWAFTVVVFLFFIFLAIAVPTAGSVGYGKLPKSISGSIDAILNTVATAWVWFVVAIFIVAVVWGLVERHRPSAPAAGSPSSVEEIETRPPGARGDAE